MRRAMIVAALLMGAALPAAAQKPGGYAVEGTNSDGSGYSGTLTMTPMGNGGAWDVVWRVGSSTYRGVGLFTDGVFSVAYVTGGRPGIATYRPQPDGSLLGPWTVQGGIGTERLIPR